MRWLRILAAIVVIGLMVGLGGAIFQTGYLAGAAASGAPLTVPYMAWGWHPFGLIGGLFGLVGTLLFVVIVFALIRLAVFGGRHRHGPGAWGDGPRRARWEGRDDVAGGVRDPWMDRARRLHEEWHRSEAGDESAPRATIDGAAGTSETDPTRQVRSSGPTGTGTGASDVA